MNMTIGIVVALEIVDIHHQDMCGAAHFPAGLPELFRLFAQPPPVIESGELIPFAEPFEPQTGEKKGFAPPVMQVCAGQSRDGGRQEQNRRGRPPPLPYQHRHTQWHGQQPIGRGKRYTNRSDEHTVIEIRGSMRPGFPQAETQKAGVKKQERSGEAPPPCRRIKEQEKQDDR